MPGPQPQRLRVTQNATTDRSGMTLTEKPRIRWPDEAQHRRAMCHSTAYEIFSKSIPNSAYYNNVIFLFYFLATHGARTNYFHSKAGANSNLGWVIQETETPTQSNF